VCGVRWRIYCSPGLPVVGCGGDVGNNMVATVVVIGIVGGGLTVIAISVGTGIRIHCLLGASWKGCGVLVEESDSEYSFLVVSAGLWRSADSVVKESCDGH